MFKNVLIQLHLSCGNVPFHDSRKDAVVTETLFAEQPLFYSSY